MEATYTIKVEPSQSPGKVTATSSDGHTFTTSMPLLDGARHWQSLGAPSSASPSSPSGRPAPDLGACAAPSATLPASP
jgi:hypothetical protein